VCVGLIIYLRCEIDTCEMINDAEVEFPSTALLLACCIQL